MCDCDDEDDWCDDERESGNFFRRIIRRHRPRQITEIQEPIVLMRNFAEYYLLLSSLETPWLRELKKNPMYEAPEYGYTKPDHRVLYEIMRFVECPRLFGGYIERWKPRPIYSTDQLNRQREYQGQRWMSIVSPTPEERARRQAALEIEEGVIDETHQES